jgi:galactitol PTS system EIIA component
MSTLAQLVAPEHVLLGCETATSDDVIRSLSSLLEATGHVGAGYADACILRETTDPTGLPTEGAAVALPHADPDLVLRPGIAVAVPARAVSFRQMGDPDVEVRAEAVFLLAMSGPEEQISALRQVAEFIQDPVRVRALVAARRPDQVCAMFVEPEEEASR